jgi:hypothetical protein
MGRRPGMTAGEVLATARALVAGDKGLLAMDESNPTCNKRFARAGIAQTEEARRAYRELIVTTAGLGECISGAILYDETIRQRTRDGIPFVRALTIAGIIPGIKVDTGAKDMAGHPGEKITEGLDGLRGRLAGYKQMGARFAKWRAVIAVGDGIPSRGCIQANAHALARYAALCQEAGLVPVVEPEVLMDGAHTLQRCGEVTEDLLRAVFTQLQVQWVTLEGCNRAARRGEYSAAMEKHEHGPLDGARHDPTAKTASMTPSPQPQHRSGQPAAAALPTATRAVVQSPAAAGPPGANGTRPGGGGPGQGETAGRAVIWTSAIACCSAMTPASSPARCSSCTPASVPSPHSRRSLSPASSWSARWPGPSARAGWLTGGAGVR